MASQKGQGDHVYLFTETSGDSLDSVGSRDLLRANDFGTPNPTAAGLEFAGDGSKGLFLATSNPFTDVGSGVLMNHDWSGFLVVEYLSSAVGIAQYLIGANVVVADFFGLNFDDVNVNKPKFQVFFSGSSQAVVGPMAAQPATSVKHYVGWSAHADGRVHIFVCSDDGTTLFEYKSADVSGNDTPNNGFQINGVSTQTGAHARWTRLEGFKSKAISLGEHQETAFDIFGLTAPSAVPTQEERDPTTWPVDNGTPVFINDAVNTLAGCEKMYDASASLGAILSKAGFGPLSNSGLGHSFVFRYKHNTTGVISSVALAQFDNDAIKAQNFIFQDDLSGVNRHSMTWFTPAASGSATSWNENQLVVGQEYIICMTDEGKAYFDTFEVKYFSAWPGGGSYSGIGALAQEDFTINGRKNDVSGNGISDISLLEYHDKALLPGEWQSRYDFLKSQEGTSPDCPPVVDNPIPDQQTIEGRPWDFIFAADTFSDPGGGPLTYIATLDDDSPLPGWLSFTGATRRFLGTPDDPDVGALDIKVIATNPGLNSAFDIFELEIFDNNAPTLDNPISDQDILEGNPYNFVVPLNTFGDLDGDTLTYTATLDDDSPLPGWLNFEPITREFSGFPSHFDVGVLGLKVIATDPSSEFAFDTFNLEILEDAELKTRNLNTAFRALLPDGRAWYINLSATFKKIVDATMSSAADVRDYFSRISNDVFPDSTRSLELWEEQFLLDSTGLLEADRRNNLAARWASQGGQSPSHLESV